MPDEKVTDLEKAIARMKSRPTTCTPEVLKAFNDVSLPELSGCLPRRFWSMQNPFWIGFFEGLAFLPLWRFLRRIYRTGRNKCRAGEPK